MPCLSITEYTCFPSIYYYTDRILFNTFNQWMNQFQRAKFFEMNADGKLWIYFSTYIFCNKIFVRGKKRQSTLENEIFIWIIKCEKSVSCCSSLMLIFPYFN